MRADLHSTTHCRTRHSRVRHHAIGAARQKTELTNAARYRVGGQLIGEDVIVQIQTPAVDIASERTEHESVVVSDSRR